MKNNMKKLLALFLVLTLVLAGCGQKAEDKKEELEDKLEDKVDQVEDKLDGDDKKEDKELGELKFTDMAGREVVLDGDRDDLLVIGSALRMYTYINGTEKLVGIEKAQQNKESGRPYIMANAEGLAALDLVGEGFPADVDPELVLTADPDVIIAGDLDIKTLEELENKTGIPVVILTTGSEPVFDEKMYESLKIIGQITGEEDRAEEVINYLEDAKKELENLTKHIEEDKRPSVYVGGLSHKGNHGIESTKANSQVLDAINANNVADELKDEGTVDIDKEQLIKWDPEIIIIDENGLGLVREDYDKNPDYYESLRAFQEGKVYGQLPYVSYYSNIETALIDTYYLGTILYPEEFKDIDPVVKADEIYEFMLGEKLYDQMAEKFGGFMKLEFK